MAQSSTVITALRYEGGVVIGSDSQATDLVGQVRWSSEKLYQIKGHPLVVGYTGSSGMAERAYEALDAADLRSTTFKNRARLRKALEGCITPIYKEIDLRQAFGKTMHQISIGGLAAFWCDGRGHILEFEMNADSSFHDNFHAVGSGTKSAYAIYHTLGGTALTSVDQRRAVWATLRIIKTAVKVEAAYVSEPIDLWVVSANGAAKLSQDEIQAQLQLVDEWESSEMRHFMESPMASE